MNVNIAHSSPKHACLDTPSDGQVSPRAVSVNPSLQLTDLQEDMVCQICRYLPMYEMNVLARSCKRLDRVIDKGFLSSNSQSWFARFGPKQQNQFRTIARNATDDDLKAWLTVPDKEPVIIEQLIRRRERNDLFTEVLSYTSSRLIAETDHFQSFSLLRVVFTAFLLVWMDFNPDGRFAVAMVRDDIDRSRCAAIIYCACHSPEAKGGWVEQLAIPCQDSSRSSLVFSSDGQHMVAACLDNKIAIYRLEPTSSRGMDKLWRKLTTIRQMDKISQITFNANGQFLATLCANGCTTILALGRAGKWLEEAVISLNVPVVSVTFADNGHRVLLGLQNESGKIYDRSSSGDWVEQIDFKQCAPVFSGDGCHVVISGIDGKTCICNRGADGAWSNRVVIDDQGLNSSAHFSPDNKFLLIHQRATIKIFAIHNQGGCAEQTILGLLATDIMSAKFSNDSQHVLINYQDDGDHATIISQEKSNIWKTTFVFHNVLSVDFSGDARFVIVRGDERKNNNDWVDSSDESDSGEEQGVGLGVPDWSKHAFLANEVTPRISLKIYGWEANREWRERKIDFGKGVLLTAESEGILLWRLGTDRQTPMGWQGGLRTLRLRTRSRILPQNLL